MAIIEVESPARLMRFWQRAQYAFFSLPIWGQWLIISAAKSILASMLMSFLAVYATLIFAVRHGFRVPLEGVHFLHLAVALVTFITFAGTLFAFSLLMFFMNYVRRNANNLHFLWVKIASGRKGFSFSLLGAKVIEILSWIASNNMLLALAGLSMMFCCLILLDSRAATIPFHFVDYLADSKTPLQIALSLSYVSLVAAAIWCVGNQLSWIAAQVLASIMIFSIMASVLFANDAYGSFLRMIRYGGGIGATILYSEGENKPQKEATGNLLILTTSHAVLYDPKVVRIFEFPLKNIVSIHYSVHPDWALPEYDLSRQRDYILFDVYRR
jgi:hypothetical protein